MKPLFLAGQLQSSVGWYGLASATLFNFMQPKLSPPRSSHAAQLLFPDSIQFPSSQSSESTYSQPGMFFLSYSSCKAQLQRHLLRGASCGHWIDIKCPILHSCDRLIALMPQCFPAPFLLLSTAFAYDFAASLTKEIESISLDLKCSVAFGLALANRIKQD